MTIQELSKFHLDLLAQRHDSLERAASQFSHVQDGSKEMAESMVLEVFKNASDALDKLSKYGCLPNK